ncbi:hypothetical protein MUO79_00305 [Candidatus Bathyarchaeota archaeon]|nr:hypothetical protein [Candidatus Bathyarchaeota archaeon]
MNRIFDGYWIWLLNTEKPSYGITGKYLFFSEDKDKLLEIATNEIENHGFHHAKINESLLEGQTEHVLCLYYKDDSRKNEIAERNKQEYKVKYRYWKNDSDTLKGKYSKEFLDKLPEDERKHFTTQKRIIEFRDKKDKLILRQKHKTKQA